MDPVRIPDCVCGCNLGHFVYVNFQEGYTWILCCEVDNMGPNHFTWTTPRCSVICHAQTGCLSKHQSIQSDHFLISAELWKFRVIRKDQSQQFYFINLIQRRFVFRQGIDNLNGIGAFTGKPLAQLGYVAGWNWEPTYCSKM
jgi:hypothetical protein